MEQSSTMTAESKCHVSVSRAVHLKATNMHEDILQSLHDDMRTCDVQLLSLDGFHVSLHACVLTSRSSLMASVLNSLTTCHRPFVLSLAVHVAKEALEASVKLFYTGQTQSLSKNISQQVLQIMDMMGVPLPTKCFVDGEGDLDTSECRQIGNEPLGQGDEHVVQVVESQGQEEQLGHHQVPEVQDERDQNHDEQREVAKEKQSELKDGESKDADVVERHREDEEKEGKSSVNPRPEKKRRLPQREKKKLQAEKDNKIEANGLKEVKEQKKTDDSSLELPGSLSGQPHIVSITSRGNKSSFSKSLKNQAGLKRRSILFPADEPPPSSTIKQDNDQEELLSTSNTSEQEQLHSDSASQEVSQVQKACCPSCGKWFSLNAGRYERHVSRCQRNKSFDEDANQNQGENLGRCRKCGEICDSYLAGTEQNCTRYERKLPGGQYSHFKCPSCQRTYSKSHRMHFERHLKTCGIESPVKRKANKEDEETKKTKQRRCSSPEVKPEEQQVADNSDHTMANETATNTKAVEETTVASPRLLRVGRDEVGWRCVDCVSTFNTLGRLKSHLINHVKADLRALMYSNDEALVTKVNEDKGLRCNICPNYRASRQEHILFHIALRHQKLRLFLQPEMGELIFPDHNEANSEKSLAHTDSKSKTDGHNKVLVENKKVVDPKMSGKSKAKEEEVEVDDKSKKVVETSTNAQSEKIVDTKINTQSKGVQPQTIDSNNIKSKVGTESKLTIHVESERDPKPNTNIESKTEVKSKPEVEMETDSTTEQSTTNGEASKKIVDLKQPFVCANCDSEFVSVQAFKGHLCEHFQADILDKLSNDSAVSRTAEGHLICPMCEHSFSTEPRLAMHAGKTHNIVLDFLSKDLRNRLLEREKADLRSQKETKAIQREQSVRCERCTGTFPSQRSLLHHWNVDNCEARVPSVFVARKSLPAEEIKTNDGGQ